MLVDSWQFKKSDQLEKMVEDDPDLEEDEYMQAYRKKRLEELKLEAGKPRFGNLREISRQDFEE
jgi:hypothetical protein